MAYWKTLIISNALLLVSCGGGSVFSGFGDLDCLSQSGTWIGQAESDSGQLSGPMRVSLSQKDCDLRGSVVFEPCVPVTPIEGTAGTGSWTVNTTDGALEVEYRLVFFGDLEEVAGVCCVNETFTMKFRFTNNKNVPNCPATDTGTGDLNQEG